MSSSSPSSSSLFSSSDDNDNDDDKATGSFTNSRSTYSRIDAQKVNRPIQGQSSWCSEEGEEDHGSRMTSGAGSSSVFTVSTGYTMPSRKRRPGAAKSRLASAKAAEKRAHNHNKGWQESIEAAAASTHRVWERSGGWLGYHDKEAAAGSSSSSSGSSNENDHQSNQTGTSTTVSSEKLHLPSNVFAKKSKRKNTLNNPKRSSDDNEIVGRSQKNKDKENGDAFFPVAWEWAQEGKDQQKSEHSTLPMGTTNKKKTESNSSKALQHSPLLWHLAMPSAEFSPSPKKNIGAREQTVFRTQNNAQSTLSLRRQQQQQQEFKERPPALEPSSSSKEITRSLSRSKGWVETMREATANLAEEGHSWDPKTGFNNLDAASTSDVITIEHPSCSASRKPAAQKQQQMPWHPMLVQQAESSVNVLEQIIADRQKYDPPGRKESIPDSSCDILAKRSQSRNRSDNNTHTVDQKNKLLQQYQQQLPRKDSNDHLSSSAEDLQSTIQEQIEVIFKSGSSVPGTANNYGIAALNFEEDEDYLLRAPTVYAPTIFVKKEKMAVKDLSLFPKSASREIEKQSLPRVSPVGARAQVRDRSPYNIKPAIEDTSKSTIKAATNLAKRRDAGPVDLDNIGALSIASSDNTEETSNVWGSAADNDSFLQGSISSIVRRQAEQGEKADGAKQTPRLSPRPRSQQKESVAWAAHAKRLSQNVRGTSQTGHKPPPDNANFRDIMENTSNVTVAANSKASLTKVNSKPSIFRGKAHCQEVERGQAVKTVIPGEIATDDASHVSTQSSVTAGWKSFLDKKVQAESAAAANQNEEGGEDTIGTTVKEGKEQRIIKTVTFDDSLLSDSLLDDSLFDFSVSDAKSLQVGSPERRSMSAPGSSWEQPSSPYRVRLNEIQEKHANSLGQDYQQAYQRPPSAAHSSFGALADSPSCSQISFSDRDTSFDRDASLGRDTSFSRDNSSDKDGNSSVRSQNCSFQTDIFPLTNIDEKADEADQEKSSFFKRLAVCKAPTVSGVQPGVLASKDVISRHEDSKEAPVACQWYLQSKLASKKVDEMMNFLRAREPIAARRRNSTTDPTTRKSTSVAAGSANSSTGSDHPQQNGSILTIDASKDPAIAAQELARAKVDAMIKNLYYATNNKKKG